MRVKAFRVKHGSWKHVYGFTFIIGDKKIVISGDTVKHQNVIKEAAAADLLIHEVISNDIYNTSQYMKKFHTSSSQVAEIGNMAMPKKIVLVHQIHHAMSPAELLKEVKNTYDGVVTYGKDLDVFTL